MPRIELYYDEVYAGPDCLIAWNDPGDESLAEWWDAASEDWFFPAAGDQDYVPTPFSPKALPGETLAHWWDAIGGLWHGVAHEYPKR